MQENGFLIKVKSLWLYNSLQTGSSEELTLFLILIWSFKLIRSLVFVVYCLAAPWNESGKGKGPVTSQRCSHWQISALFFWDTFNPVHGYWKGTVNSAVLESSICPADQGTPLSLHKTLVLGAHRSTVCSILFQRSMPVKSALQSHVAWLLCCWEKCSLPLKTKALKMN